MIIYDKLNDYLQVGRLGNQMFEIASTIGIAIKNKHNYAFPLWTYNNYYTYFENPLPSIPTYLNYTRLKESTINKYQIFDIKPDINYALSGYFQCYEYFDFCKDIILNYFKLKQIHQNHINYNYKFNNSVSIHVRRGDYINFPNYHPIQSIEYFNNALNLIKQKDNIDRIYICSDDIQWCKDNLKYNNIIYVEGESPIIDMFIMANCNHNIIANSSFSWWSAYLNKNPNKIVIAPKNWWGPDYIKQGLNTEQLLPKQWIQL